MDEPLAVGILIIQEDPLGGGGAAGPGGEHLRWQRQAEEQTGERQGEEQRPLELWRDMASFVAGPREDAISTAFSQEAPHPSSQPGATVSPPTPAQGTSATPPAQLAQASGVAADTVDGAGGVRWRSQRSKFTVDFQKIYLYLAGVGRHQRDCILTPMECAVVLDLLMTLPEELPLLDSPELRQHMSKTYFSLSAPAPTPPGEANGAMDNHAMDNRATDNHAMDNHATDNHAMDNRATDNHAMDHRATAAEAQTQAPESGLCPLNPFVVPLKLLVKRT
ncbi:hypothetical protein CRUP_013663 [Coryphaenoides rupestris]|nr:hypothetical protein CRUP_013663 [Coryphaenoides rupestris]